MRRAHQHVRRRQRAIRARPPCARALAAKRVSVSTRWPGPTNAPSVSCAPSVRSRRSPAAAGAASGPNPIAPSRVTPTKLVSARVCSVSRVSSSRPSQVIAVRSRSDGTPGPGSGMPSGVAIAISRATESGATPARSSASASALTSVDGSLASARHVERDVVGERAADQLSVGADAAAEPARRRAERAARPRSVNWSCGGSNVMNALRR